ncbi:hypothetical protein EVAR_51237_1 [Eumeta japonica]|uniref:Mariner Mos1 transposase n=1 Tax=Eumeta variegata TaxID=151549 RepID=A0A4C1X2P7_EUMVA|nr:hypothetical protein EVAR_51237_1 [Eumeta japonica]
MSQLHKILHEYLTVRKLCIRWIPHNLTDVQKLRRDNCCREMMQNLPVVFQMLYTTWLQLTKTDSKPKRQSAQWVFPFQELPAKVKRGRSVGIKMVASF